MRRREGDDLLATFFGSAFTGKSASARSLDIDFEEQKANILSLQNCTGCRNRAIRPDQAIEALRKNLSGTNRMPDFSTPASHAFDPPTFPSDSLPSTSTSTSTPTLSLFERYSIPQTLSYLNDEHPEYKTIALQFPDELLGDSVLVYRGLMKGLKQPGGAGVKGKGRERQCYVLGDSTYGSCCPDVLSSLHLPADVLIHYGHACLTR